MGDIKEFKFFCVDYEKTNGQKSSLVIEGFGPETLLGAIRDLVEGNFTPPNDSEVVSIRLTRTPPDPVV